MTFYLKAAVAAALVALLPPTASASRQRFDLETFDNAPAGPIHPGQIVALEHFRVRTASGTTAAFKPAGQSDELASGLVLGAPEHGGPASIDLLFDTPRESVTFTVVLPPDASALQSTAVVYGAGGEQHQALAIRHSMAGHRVRLNLSEPKGRSFDRLALRLQPGAYIDGVEIASPVDPGATVIDFDELPSGPLTSTDQGRYLVMVNSGRPWIAAASDAETSGQVLTSGTSTGNDFVVFYRSSRRMLELTVVPDASGEPARIEFLGAGHFNTLHTVHVDPKGGPQRLSYVAEGGNTLQGIRWTGGKLQIDDVTLQPE